MMRAEAPSAPRLDLHRLEAGLAGRGGRSLAEMQDEYTR